jgi:hypothetical protein
LKAERYCQETGICRSRRGVNVRATICNTGGTKFVDFI